MTFPKSKKSIQREERVKKEREIKERRKGKKKLHMYIDVLFSLK